MTAPLRGHCRALLTVWRAELDRLQADNPQASTALHGCITQLEQALTDTAPHGECYCTACGTNHEG